MHGPLRGALAAPPGHGSLAAPPGHGSLAPARLKAWDKLPASDGEVLSFFACRRLCQENARGALNCYGVNLSKVTFNDCEKRCDRPPDLARLVQCRTFCHAAFAGAESFECMGGCLPPAVACRGYCYLQPSLPTFRVCEQKCGTA